MDMKLTGLIIAFYLLIQPCYSSGSFLDNTGEKLTKKQLTEDSRQLLNYIESIHPDPYIYSGGKVEFHRRFQEILGQIPENGLTKDEYIGLIRPFIASISDAHTRISSAYDYDRDNPGGLPFTFGSVEKTIYVDKVYSREHRHLLGAKLESVEGIPIREIMDRLYCLQGIENDYHCILILKTYLRIRPYLSMLVPEWEDKSSLKAGFTLKDGRKETISVSTSSKAGKKSFCHETEVNTPDVSKGFFNYAFTGPDKKCYPEGG